MVWRVVVPAAPVLFDAPHPEPGAVRDDDEDAATTDSGRPSVSDV